MIKIKNYVSLRLLILAMVSVIGGLLVITALPQTVSAATPTSAADCPSGDTFVPSSSDNPGVAYCVGPTTCGINGGTWDKSSSTCKTTTSSSTTSTKTSYTCSTAPKFLTFPQWYRGLNVGAGDTKADCAIISPDKVGGLSNFIWRIALNVIEILMQAVAYLVAGFILVAGFRLLTSEGQPERAVSARNTIIMAAVGFAISVAAVAALNFVSGIF